MQDRLCGMYAPQGRLTRRALKASFRGKHEVLLPEGEGRIFTVGTVGGRTHCPNTLHVAKAKSTASNR